MLALQCEHIKGDQDSIKNTKRTNTQSEHLLRAFCAPITCIISEMPHLDTKAEISIGPAFQGRTLGHTEANLSSLYTNE